jgi:hypothetical protein
MLIVQQQLLLPLLPINSLFEGARSLLVGLHLFSIAGRTNALIGLDFADISPSTSFDMSPQF